MRKCDLIYKDKNYEIYKNDVGTIGTFLPLDCLEIIDIAISELADWDNAGFAQPKDYQKIIDKICSRLQNTVKGL